MYGKGESQNTSFANTEDGFSVDIRKEFGLRACGLLVLRRVVNFKYIDGIVLSSEEVMRQIDHDDGYGMKVHGIYRRLLWKSDISSLVEQDGQNKFETINTWAVSLLKCGARLIVWTEGECSHHGSNPASFHVPT